jgi:rabenosyn-5
VVKIALVLWVFFSGIKEMEDENIKEGFICPVCMKEFNIPAQLQKHFEDFHSEDHDALRQIRGMFEKAKRKILKKPEAEDQDGAVGLLQDANDGSTTVLRGIDPFLWDDQEFGKSSNELDSFENLI